MNKLISLGIGVAVGAAFGVGAVLLFAPMSGEQLKYALRKGYQDTLAEARLAAVMRRAELEAELARKQGKTKEIVPR